MAGENKFSRFIPRRIFFFCLPGCILVLIVNHHLHTYFCLLIACSNLLALVAGTGAHLHLLQKHIGEVETTDLHYVVVHAHEDSPTPVPLPSHADDREHRHLISTIHIVGLHPSSTQTASPSIIEFEPFAVLRSVLSLDSDASCWLISTDGSPPCSLPLTEDLPGRSPPLA